MALFILGISLLVGNIIGAGLFGLPYVTAQIGFIPMMGYFLILGFVVLIIHLAYGEIVLRTSGNHRLPGLVEIYLGPRYKKLSTTNSVIGLCGSNLAYLVLGGTFMWGLLGPFFGGSIVVYTLIFFAAGALCTYGSQRSLAFTQLLGLGLLFIIMVLFFSQTAEHIRFDNFTFIKIEGFLAPYGIVMFSLAGMSAVPEIRELLGKRISLFKPVIIWGTVGAAAISLLFTIMVFGTTGQASSQDALSGLELILGRRIIMIGYTLGIITTFTSYLALGLTLKKTFQYDSKLSHGIAWLLASIIPIGLYTIGFNNFITVAAFIGAVTIAADGILIFVVYEASKRFGKRKPEYSLTLPRLGFWLLVSIFLFGASSEILRAIFS